MMSKFEESKRQSAFVKNEELESLLKTLNQSLAPAEDLLTAQFASQEIRHPIIFIMGPLRSGTTLLMQWLATTGIVAYPTNLLSRFYRAPTIGAMVQLLLTDRRYNFRNEIFEFETTVDFSSENGKTRGALSPNEFWYFWRRFLPNSKLDFWSDEQLSRAVDKNTLVSELYSISHVFEKPFALKGMILNYNIPFLDGIFEKALFIQTYRNPVANVVSALEARERQYGSRESWYSFKIPEYSELANMDPLHQCAGQVTYINKAISQGMSQVDESRRMVVEYERFCHNPEETYRELLAKLGLRIEDFPYSGEPRFAESREIDDTLQSSIRDALAIFK